MADAIQENHYWLRYSLIERQEVQAGYPICGDDAEYLLVSLYDA